MGSENSEVCGAPNEIGILKSLELCWCGGSWWLGVYLQGLRRSSQWMQEIWVYEDCLRTWFSEALPPTYRQKRMKTSAAGVPRFMEVTSRSSDDSMHVDETEICGSVSWVRVVLFCSWEGESEIPILKSHVLLYQ